VPIGVTCSGGDQVLAKADMITTVRFVKKKAAQRYE